MTEKDTQRSNKSFWIVSSLFSLLFFFIPMEHKYDKLFRFYSLTLIPHNLSLPAYFDKKIYFYLSDLLALFLFGWVLTYLRKNSLTKESLFLIGFLFCAFTSVCFSPFANYPIGYWRLLHLFTPIALFCTLSSRWISQRVLFPVFSWSLFSSGLVQAVIALTQYFSQKPLGLRLLGEQPLTAKIHIPNGRIWLFDHISQIYQSGANKAVYRALGTMPHPNVLGGLFVISLLTTTHFFLEKRSWRIWLIPCHLLQLMALATTYSRSALFAYLLATLIYVSWNRLRNRQAIRSTLFLVCISGMLTATLFSEQYLHRGGVVNYTNTSRQSDQERLFYQSVALNMIQSHPFLGVGFGQFSLRAPAFLPKGVDPQSAISATHNIYLMIATETGLLSLFLFLSWAALLLSRSFRSIERDTGLLFSLFVAFLFIGLFDFYPILFQQGKLLFFSIAGLLGAKASSKKRHMITPSLVN